MRSPEKPAILLVEDTIDDTFFFRRALGCGGFDADLVHAPDGDAAVQILRASRTPDGRRAPGCPSIVFLDLKMPMASGFEVLAWLRDHPFHPPLDVAVLSGSDRDADETRARELGASAFYVKPLGATNLRAHLDAWQSRRDRADSR